MTWTSTRTTSKRTPNYFYAAHATEAPNIKLNHLQPVFRGTIKHHFHNPIFPGKKLKFADFGPVNFRGGLATYDTDCTHSTSHFHSITLIFIITGQNVQPATLEFPLPDLREQSPQ